MAGIWEYIHTAGDESQTRINVSLFRTALTSVALGLATRAQALAAIESALGEEIVGDALTDLNAIADLFETGTSTARLVYAATVEAALNAGELNLINEATFRTWVGI